MLSMRLVFISVISANPALEGSVYHLLLMTMLKENLSEFLLFFFFKSTTLLMFPNVSFILYFLELCLIFCGLNLSWIYQYAMEWTYCWL